MVPACLPAGWSSFKAGRPQAKALPSPRCCRPLMPPGTPRSTGRAANPAGCVEPRPVGPTACHICGQAQLPARGCCRLRSSTAGILGQILLRADWLYQASAEDVHDLLNHELGHHLDALLQLDDSPAMKESLRDSSADVG